MVIEVGYTKMYYPDNIILDDDRAQRFTQLKNSRDWPLIASTIDAVVERVLDQYFLKYKTKSKRKNARAEAIAHAVPERMRNIAYNDINSGLYVITVADDLNAVEISHTAPDKPYIPEFFGGAFEKCMEEHLTTENFSSEHMRTLGKRKKQAVHWVRAGAFGFAEEMIRLGV